MRSNAQLYTIGINTDCFKALDKYERSKVTRARQGITTNQPRSNYGRVMWEIAMRAYKDEHPVSPSNGGDEPPTPPPPDPSWGWWDKPTVMCHAHDGGVEYQEEQVKYFGSVMLDMNDPGGISAWDTFRARATRAGLKTCFWKHCHNYSDIAFTLDRFKLDGTGGLNLEDVVSEGIDPKVVAQMIDQALGPQAILAIPTLGWIQGIDWSPLNRHVFLLEFFPNDPPADWVGKDLDYLVRACAENAQNHGVVKFSYVCGVYLTTTNPNARLYSATEYLTALRNQNQKFGGIYLGDNNGPNYAQWA